MNSRLTQYCRALIRPGPIVGMAIIAVFWLGLVFVLPSDYESGFDYEHRRWLFFTAACIVTLLEVLTMAAGIGRQQASGHLQRALRQPLSPAARIAESRRDP